MSTIRRPSRRSLSCRSARSPTPFNMSASRIELPFTVQADGSLLVDLPSNPNVLTPGYWMLFAINNDGTPSIASTIQVGTELLYDLPAQLPLDLLDANIDPRAQRRRRIRRLQRSLRADSRCADQARKLHVAGARRPQPRRSTSRSRSTSATTTPAATASASCSTTTRPGNHALGAAGGGQGLTGIQNGVGIEFDTDHERQRHCQRSHGLCQDRRAAAALSPVTDLGNIEDGQWHQVHVISDGETISYTFDGVVVASDQPRRRRRRCSDRISPISASPAAPSGLTEQEQRAAARAQAVAEGGEQVSLDRADLPQPVTVHNERRTQPTTRHSKSYVVTPDAQLQHGSVMATTRVDLSKPFKLIFDINVGNDPNGADGMGFVLHNDAAGSMRSVPPGGGQGDDGDPERRRHRVRHVQQCRRPTARDRSNRLCQDQRWVGAKSQTAIGLGNIEDGLWHRVEIVSDGQTISYTFDGVRCRALSLATVEMLLGGTSLAYWGLTGATGGTQRAGAGAARQDGGHRRGRHCLPNRRAEQGPHRRQRRLYGRQEWCAHGVGGGRRPRQRLRSRRRPVAHLPGVAPRRSWPLLASGAHQRHRDDE